MVTPTATIELHDGDHRKPPNLCAVLVDGAFMRYSTFGTFP